MLQQMGKNLEKVRKAQPLVHHITNYVTVNDCANITLQVGALPVMADAWEEMEDMVSISGCLVINIGTLNTGLIKAMIKAGKKANELGIPVVLDPVGAGATKLRTESALKILKEIRVDILKGNSAEIGVLAGLSAQVRGVEAGEVAGDLTMAAQQLATRLQNTVVVTGVQDMVLSASRCLIINNGHLLMSRLSGTGCMCASVVGAFAAAVPDYFEAAASALTCFGINGELAAQANVAGPYSYRTAFFDSMASLSAADILRLGRVEEI